LPGGHLQRIGFRHEAQRSYDSPIEATRLRTDRGSSRAGRDLGEQLIGSL
jgi:hypothetical protein